jgi:hypothetical protein
MLKKNQLRVAEKARGEGALTYHVRICVRDDVGREIPGLDQLAEDCEPFCGIDCSNWKELTHERKTPKHTHTHTP